MYTPKQWSVIDGHYPAFKEVAGPSFKLSVVMLATDLTEDDYQKRTADLHLIAAAPELLSALQAAALAIHEYRTQGAPHAYWDDIEAQSEAAIEKAMGVNNDQG